MSDSSRTDLAVEREQAQGVLREVNDAMRRLNAALAGADLMADWVCECGDALCLERIALTLDQYDRVRAHRDQFAVFPTVEHVAESFEAVTMRTDRFWVVQKRGVHLANNTLEISQVNGSEGQPSGSP